MKQYPFRLSQILGKPAIFFLLLPFISFFSIAQENVGLKDLKSQMLMGGCVSDGAQTYFNNNTAKALVLKDCEVATVQCYPAWGRWDESLRHVYHLDDFNGKLREIKKNSIPITAHMLMGWDLYFPDWYRKNDFPADTLDAILKSWIKSIIQFKGNDTLVDIWNVVNEAISWNGQGGYWPLNSADQKSACEMQRIGFEPDSSGLTGSQLVNPSHPLYIRKSFEYARQFTNRKLELRDASIEFPTDSKYKAFYQLAVHLRKVKAPVDVIGFQCHLNVEQIYDWEGLSNNIKRYKELGYQVNITEVDIGDPTKKWTSDKADLQKLMYYRLVTSAIKGGATEFHTWGFNDDNNTGWRYGEKAFPYSNNFTPKPAYYGMREALIDMSHILFWEMDAMKGDTMPDVMMYGNHGIAYHMANPVLTTGFKNKALQFDGIDDYIQTGPLSDSIYGKFTLAFFFKTTANGEMIIASLNNDLENPELEIVMNASGKLFVSGATLNKNLESDAAINDGLWHFLALQSDSLRYYLYLDSAQPADSTEGLPVAFNSFTAGAGVIGNKAFSGSLDELKLYNTFIESASFMRNMVPFCPLKPTLTQNKMIMRLGWTDQSVNEEGYVIERKTASGEWEAIKILGKVSNYTDTVKLYNTLFTYRIRSFNRFGLSDPSMSLSATSPVNPNTAIHWKQETSTGNRVYPIPFSDSFYIDSQKPVSVKVYDLCGQLVVCKDGADKLLKIQTQHWPSGAYFVSIEQEGFVENIKIVKR